MLKRSPMPRPSKAIVRISAKRLARLIAARGGRYPTSTFAPKSPAGGASPAARPRVSSSSRILPDAVAVVKERSGGVCEIQLEGCWGRATERSHRLARGMGGRKGAAKAASDRPSDLLDSCVWCHLVITRHPWRVRANFHGWVLTHAQEPTACKVLRHGVWAFLDDAGGVQRYDEAGPQPD